MAVEMSETITTGQAMNDIVTWSASIEFPMPLWQRDALRRLFVKHQLSEPDIAELAALCKKPHQLLGDDEPLAEAQPLEPKHLPSGATVSKAVALEAISQVEGVNALVPKQSLSFRHGGLSVVYGNNGSGKSGYVRILKRACRARVGEEVLPNVYGQTIAVPPAATISYSIGGEAQPPYRWEEGKASPAVLSAISVFDSKCASVHVEEKNEAAYTPVPLQILQELAKACRAIREKLKAMEADQMKAVPASLQKPKYHAGTAVSRFLHKLTGGTTHEELGKLATLSDDEKARLEQLRELFRADPNTLANVLNARKLRVDAILARVQRIEGLLGTDSLTEYRELLADSEAKVNAAQAAAGVAFGDEPLPFIGEPSWRALWEAAHTFSLEHAYPDRQFPHTTDRAVCVLCQQPLNAEATSRLTRFEEYVRNTAQKNADEAVGKVNARLQQIRSAIPAVAERRQDLSLFCDELQERDSCRLLRRFYRVSAVRAAYVGRTVCHAHWPAYRDYGISPKQHLQRISDGLATRISELRASVNSKERQELEKEWHQLEDREWLSSVSDDVKHEIVRQRNLANIKAAFADTDTTRITRKSGELADQLVTTAWKARFRSEVSRLGIRHLSIELLRESGTYGTAKYRISLIGSNGRDIGRVLSEGEHRCIALAAFLSELATANDDSGIVFDDPVSSLDHAYRDLIAQRLSDEAAAGRQVIVFTHDVMFLEMLSRHSGDLHSFTVSAWPDSTKAGLIERGLPSCVAPPSEELCSIRRQIKQLSGLYESGRMVEWGGYANSLSLRLRKCWERLVAHAVSGVVRRFDEPVTTKNIWHLAAIDEVHCKTMRDAYKRCSELSHERCAEQNRSDPSPNDFLSELDVASQWLTDVSAAQQTAMQNRV